MPPRQRRRASTDDGPNRHCANRDLDPPREVAELVASTVAI